MNVTRNVVLDLLPLYLAGEASEDTRALVEAYLARDPELAALAARGERPDVGAELGGAGATSAAAPELELRTLRRTRRRLAAQRWLFGLAWFFTAIALSTEVSFDQRPVRVRLLLLEHPTALAPAAAGALLCWGAYVMLRRRGRSVA